MFRAHQRSPRPDGQQPAPPDGGGAYLRLVDADVYTDWESVYRDNVERLYRLMYARVGNRPDAEDLTSEVFRTAFGPLRLASSKGEVRSYLLVTARTVLASHWRRRLGMPVTSIDPAADLAYLAEPSGLAKLPRHQSGPAPSSQLFPIATGASSSSGSSRRARSRRWLKPWMSA